MTYEIFHDKYQDKYIHYVLFPDDPFTGTPHEIEIQAVFNEKGEQCIWTKEEEEEWTDEILREVIA